MTDWLGPALVGAATVGAIAYAIRVARRGRFENGRLGSVSPGLLGRPLVEAAYWVFGPIARRLARLGVTPDQVTFFSLALGAVAGVLLAVGRLGLAAVIATLSSMCDTLDGEMARELGTSSDSGEVLDAAADRYNEFFFLAGAAVFYRDVVWQLAAVLAALLASFMVSYATAKAEAMRVEAPGGAMRRHERVFFLLLGLALSPALPSLGPVRAAPLFVAVLLVAIVGNLSAARRLVATAKLVGK